MTPKNSLEIEGTFLKHPFAELVTEIAQAQLDGSLRVTNGEKKCVVYFREGRIVFAASNARESRLFEILMRQGMLMKEELGKVPNFQNDFELAAWLEGNNRLSVDEKNHLFTGQIKAIILDILSWQAGIWTFSSLARVRDGLDFEIDARQLFIDYARCMDVNYVAKRFRSMDECFNAIGNGVLSSVLTAEEAYILACTADKPTPVAELVNGAAIPNSTVLHAIYTLWLGGLVSRSGWQTALSAHSVEAMRSAKLELKRSAKIVAPLVVTEHIKDSSSVEITSDKPKEIVITLDEYLKQVETAKTHYDSLGVDPAAELAEIKRAYFSMAKMFHPDKYHSESDENFQRIQHAFTLLTQAHEALKNVEVRELYDYRMRKELADREQIETLGEAVAKANSQAEQAAVSFDRGFNLLVEGDLEAALPFLARAVHYDPSVARYHAYYGKALSQDEDKRHKAEAELQAAIKLDPESPTFRVLLAEFFIQYNLLKRAQGELTRLLEKFPDNREAQKLLDGLLVKA